MDRDLINHDDETTCPECQGVGRVKKSLVMKSFDKEEPKLDYICADDLRSCERKIYELNVKEFRELMVECLEMQKQREIDTSMEEYNRLTTKPIGGESHV